MLIMLENYPDRSQTLTVQETALMDRYVTTPIGALSRISTSLLAQLKRFDQPFLETVRLTNHTNQKVTPARRLLFQSMMQTGLAFWNWPKAGWIEVIEPYPSGHTAGGIRFWMLTLAYLFGGFLHVAASTNYNLMADAVFGKDLVDAQVDTLYAPLLQAGYSSEKSTRYRFRWMTALTLLVNRHPSVEALSAPVIATVNYPLAAPPPPHSLTAHQKRRNPLLLLQTSLCQLGLLYEPFTLETKTPPNQVDT